MTDSDYPGENDETKGGSPFEAAGGAGATDGPPALDIPGEGAADSGQVGTVVPAAEPEASPHVAGPGDFAQHYSLLFCCTAMFIAAVCLPIEGRHLDLYAKDSISGGFLTVFAGYGVLAKWMNIHSSKMIVWPAFIAAADGIYLCTMRALQLVKQIETPDAMDFRDWIHLFGPGYYVIAICSLMVIWTLFTAVMSGAKKEAARKEAAKAARGSKR